MLLIDLSYYIFYRYYAIYAWYKKQDGNLEDVMKDKVFMDKYNKIFEKTVCDLKKQFGVEWSDVYFAKDCPRDKIWRMSSFPEYKKSRDERSDVFDKNIFVHTITVLIPLLQTKYNFKLLSVDKMEADDIIAVVKNYVRKDEPKKEIFIVTNDNDYVQLIDDFTLIVNLQGKDLKSRIDCNPSEYLERKIIMGDKSDNIPSIARLIGEKKAAKLAINREALQAIFNKNPDAKKQYDLNRYLISFEMIPTNYVNDAIQNYIRTF